jgi:ATP-dependent 26S proteasome regulatory subunit
MKTYHYDAPGKHTGYTESVTSDCKQKWLGWSAEKRKTVYAEARTKQPSLIFIDELDAVCPPRGMYSDSISQEASAQLL